MYLSLNQLSPTYLSYQTSTASALQGSYLLPSVMPALVQDLIPSIITSFVFTFIFFTDFLPLQFINIVKVLSSSKKNLPSSFISLLATALSHSYQNQGRTLRVAYTHYLYFSTSYAVFNPPPLPKTGHKKRFIITDCQIQRALLLGIFCSCRYFFRIFPCFSNHTSFAGFSFSDQL